MKKLQFSIDIKAPKEKVWNALWDDANYRKWSSAFMEGSYAETDWREGSRVKFLTPSGEGMFSTIERKIPNELMSFKHLGILKDGKEQPPSDESREFAGSKENYTLQQIGDSTRLNVEIEASEEFVDTFNKSFPSALEKVREISEKSKSMAEATR